MRCCSSSRSRHVEVDEIEAAGDLLLLDARRCSRCSWSTGCRTRTLFNTHVPAAIARLCRGRKDCTIRAYGEMVDVLWQDGLTAAAIRLEMLWNQLAMTPRLLAAVRLCDGQLLQGCRHARYLRAALARHWRRDRAEESGGQVDQLVPRIAAPRSPRRSIINFSWSRSP